MCGISGYYVKNPGAIRHGSLELLTDGLLYGIANRGWDATGIAAFTADTWGNPHIEKSDDDAGKFCTERDDLPLNLRAVLLHTRYATQGHQIFNVNNHPVKYGSIHTVHNGIIWNDDSIFYKLGLKRKAEVDSEAISASLFYHGIDKPGKALVKLTGSMAIAAACSATPNTVLLARGADSPLWYHESENLIVWASTPDAIVKGWGFGIGTPPKFKKIHSVGEGTILVIHNGEITRDRFKPQRGYVNRQWYQSDKPTVESDSCVIHGKSVELMDSEDTMADIRKSDSYNNWTPSTYLSCNSCKELQPWSEMVATENGFMICSDCALYGDFKAENIAQCEYCGTFKDLIRDEFGFHICDTCFQLLLNG